MKQETIEEAAEKYAKGLDKNSAEDFISGAKWQAKQMYSEEEMQVAFFAGLRAAHGSKKHSVSWKEWFEQFKKK